MRREDSAAWTVEYVVKTSMDEAAVMGYGSCRVVAPEADVRDAALDVIHDCDVRVDPRIDPQIVILAVSPAPNENA